MTSTADPADLSNLSPLERAIVYIFYSVLYLRHSWSKARSA